MLLKIRADLGAQSGRIENIQSSDNVSSQAKDNVSYQAKDNVYYQAKGNVSYQAKDNVSYQAKANVSSQAKDNVYQQAKDNVSYQAKDNVSYQTKDNVSYQAKDNVLHQAKANVSNHTNNNIVSNDLMAPNINVSPPLLKQLILETLCKQKITSLQKMKNTPILGSTPGVESDTKMTEMQQNIEKENVTRKEDDVRFSNCMKEAVKVICRICLKKESLTGLRKHTKDRHQITITEYKNQFGQPEIVEMVLHKCNLCYQTFTLDSDQVAKHLKRSHREVSYREYSARFLTTSIGKSQSNRLPGHSY